MAKESVLVVSYGSRGAAIADALYRSKGDYRIHFADKQNNPFNRHLAQRTSGRHVVIPDLSAHRIYELSKELKGDGGLDFVFPGPEGPIIHGLADKIEDGLGVPVLAPRQDYAIERSKAEQRRLIQTVCPEANPRFYVAHGDRSGSVRNTQLPDAIEFMESLDYKVAIKPDKPAVGKGVVVYGDHFVEPNQALALLSERLKEGDVVVEEFIDGEESSYQALSDGENLADLPDSRDYKRALDGDRGANTGGMGIYMDVNNHLPFMTPEDRSQEQEMIRKVFDYMKGGSGFNGGLKGVPYYVAFTHTGKGPKILEINSRFGDPEAFELAALESDFGEVCWQMRNRSLKPLIMKNKAVVAVYLVPPSYGGRNPDWKGSMKLRTRKLNGMMYDADDNLRIYPGSIESRNGKVYMKGSRAIAVVGLRDSIADAGGVAYSAASEIMEENPNLEMREEIGSRDHIDNSIRHIERLRGVVGQC